MPTITPCLWFDQQSLEAATFYTSIFPNSRITEVTRNPEGALGEPGAVLTVAFELDGTPVLALDGGPQFTFSEAVSFTIDCADQAEVDYYWERLGRGGEESQCGWLKDRFGFSWQVVPRRMLELLADPDPGRSSRAVQAMLGMRKLDVGALEAAAAGS